MSERIEFKELIATFNPTDVAFIQSLLQANEIVHYVEGEHFAALRPLAAPARIWVDKESLEDAKELLKDYKSGKFGYQVD